MQVAAKADSTVVSFQYLRKLNSVIFITCSTNETLFILTCDERSVCKACLLKGLTTKEKLFQEKL
jgi:hypothetical protein